MDKSSGKGQEFAERLRLAREKRNLSQSDLAERSGLQPSAVSHFETGRRAPSFDNLKRLADALEVTTDYLLGRAEGIAASGPTVSQLFRNASQISKDDLQLLAKFAAELAKRNEKKD